MITVKSIDEIKAGDVITIKEWKTIRCRSWLGSLITVKMVDAPYMIVDIEKNNESPYDYKDRVLLFSEYEFLIPSKEYIEKLRSTIAS